MKYVFLTKILVIISLNSFSQINDKVWNYIQQYHNIAITEMQRTGIPASITLAQGLLESGIGESRLAIKGNNHFGIKCHNWQGPTMRHSDDKPNECFRVYPSAYESYIDHSDFLSNRSRYSRLFEYEANDYENWAKGLKACGYATNPKYADLLIERIEKYYLHIFDKNNWQELLSMVSLNRQLSQGKTVVQTTTSYHKNEEQAIAKPVTNYQPPTKVHTPVVKNTEVKVNEPISETTPVESKTVVNNVPKMPTTTIVAKNKQKIKEEEPVIENKTTAVIAPTFIIKTVNGKATINYNLPINLLQVSRDYGISIKKLMDYNEVEADFSFNTNANIFIQKKRKRYKGKHKKHKVKTNETLHSIAQNYGLSLNHLKKINKLNSKDKLNIGTSIKLKGRSKFF